MADPSRPTKSPRQLSSSAIAPAYQTSGPGSVRPRNRRFNPDASDYDRPLPQPSERSSSLLSAWGPSNSRGSSPKPPGSSGGSRSRPKQAQDAAGLGQFLGDSWAQSWASVQGLASTLLPPASDRSRNPAKSEPSSRAGSRPGAWGRDISGPSTNKSSAPSWGPPPPSQNLGLGDVATGSLAERDAALRAARTASVLESHDGVNGGLDVTGKHKRRNSDEPAVDNDQPEDYLVYVHHVQPEDTYAGLILRYRCSEDAFRKANGLWSRDTVQTRKWLTIPVATCEIRGRACDPPSWYDSQGVDLLAPTPPAEAEPPPGQQEEHDDFLGRTVNAKPAASEKVEGGDRPWTHVRWVAVDSFREPVEIGRVARQAMGYFPPRRKKSIMTVSSLSTPRQSSDFSVAAPGSLERASTRRQSSLSSRPAFPGTPLSSRSRGGSETADGRPAWMRRPGGVGTMSRNVRTPGPDKDYLNTWATKHLPALNIEGLPSMSITGSEVAHFGFSSESAGIVENPFEGGRDAMSNARQGNGLDKAAAAVETWLRGALARRPSTSRAGNRAWSNGGSAGGSAGNGVGDLIELTDAASDDGRPFQDQAASRSHAPALLRTTSRTASDGDGNVRGRKVPGSKGQKSD